MSRRRYTKKEKKALLREFERSGDNAAAFCREHGVGYHSFLAWRRGAKDEAPEFVELEVQRGEVERPRPVVGSAAVELVLGGGMVLRIYQGESTRP